MNIGRKVYLATWHDDFVADLRKTIASAMSPYAELLGPELFTPGQTLSETIQDQISESDIVIVDVSDANPNVMWEFGYAVAMGKAIIPITSSEISSLPADVRQYIVIKYEKTHEGLIELGKKIFMALSRVHPTRVAKVQKSAILYTGYDEAGIGRKLASSRELVDMISVSASGVANQFHAHVTSCFDHGVRFRILLLDPECDQLSNIAFLHQYDKDHYRSQLRHDLLSFVSLIWKLPSKMRSLVQLRLCAIAPMCRFVRIDDEIYLSLSPYASGSRSSLVALLDANDPRVSSALLDYFNATWESSVAFDAGDESKPNRCSDEES